MKIRKAKPSDIDQIYEVFLTMLKAEDKASEQVDKIFLEMRTKRKDIEKSAKAAILKKIKGKGHLFLVAEEKKIVGYSHGYTQEEYKDFFLPITSGYLNALCIKEGMQGKGLASLLNQEMEKWFKKKKCKVIYLDVFSKNPAVAVYEKWGYKVLSYTLGKKLKF
ncbi:MAG: GNAT family N-acetyltransferase [Candidatus Nanoarchaeia archaeon]